jgi:hypothetical protein
MRWQVKTYPIFTWALVTGALALWHGWGVGTTLVFATFFIVPYLLWARPRQETILSGVRYLRSGFIAFLTFQLIG